MRRPRMPILTDVVVGLVALIHVNVLVIEMLLWDRPAGRRSSSLRPLSTRDGCP